MNQDDVFSHPYIDHLFFLQVDITMHLKVHESEAPRHEYMLRQVWGVVRPCEELYQVASSWDKETELLYNVNIAIAQQLVLKR